jgi:predicted nucleic acid-binding Zn finger protein
MGGKPCQEDLSDGTALLRIETMQGVVAHYWVFHRKNLTRIKRMDTGTVYALNLRAGTCTCPDHVNRKIECKHVKAVRTALS